MTRHARQARYQRGIAAERWAAWYLRAKGYAILAQRLRTPCGEIDILARQGNTLVLVEVKARKSIDDGLAAVRPEQQQRIANAALAVLARKGKMAKLIGNMSPDVRFDVIVMSPKRWPVHLKQAWRV